MHRDRSPHRPGAAAGQAEEERSARVPPVRGSPGELLALQASVGNQAVARALVLARDRGSATGSQAPGHDAGAPSTDAGTTTAPDAGTATAPDADLETRLDAIESRYRGMVTAARADGKTVAADNLEHFLDGGGGTRTLGVPWLRGFDVVTGAERTNQGRFEKSLNDQANAMSDGETRTFTDHWHRQFTASVTTELYYASGTSTLKSTGTFTLTRAGDVVTITGTVQQHWYDPYDWHAGLGAFIPGVGAVSDADALLLERHGRAASYEMEADWTQTVSGTISIGTLWNSEEFTWSGP